MNQVVDAVSSRRGFWGSFLGMAAAGVSRGSVPALGAKVEGHLAKADKSCREAADRAIGSVGLFFANCENGIPGFVDDASGWYSYGYAIRDLMPFTSRARLRGYLERSFEARFFSVESLRKFLESVALRFQGEIEAAENILFRDVAPEIDSLAPVGAKATSPALLRASFNAILARTEATVSRDHATATVQAAAGYKLSELVVQIAGRVLSSVVAKLAARTGSKGIVAVGAGGGILGMACALMLDALINWLWDWWTDPRGKLSAQLRDQFREIRSLVIGGVDGEPGLRAELSTLLDARAEARREALARAAGRG